MRELSSAISAGTLCRFRCATLAIGIFTVEASGLDAADAPFRRGDANVDGVVDLADGVRILGALFLGDGDFTCEDALDADDSGVLDLSDAIYLLRHLFAGTPAPPTPGIENCGLDFLGRDSLSCDEYRPADASLACHARAAEDVLPLPLFLANSPTPPLAICDFNGDEQLDILSTSERQLEIRFGVPGRRLSAPQLVDDVDARSLARVMCADLDGVDGVDVVRYGTWRYRVLSNDGSGRFRLTDGRPVFGQASRIQLEAGVAVDVNRDDVLDLVFFAGSTTAQRLTIESLVVVVGIPGGGFELPVYPTLPSPTRVAPQRALVSADFDGDNLEDVAFLEQGAGFGVLLLLNNGDTTFLPKSVPTFETQTSLVTGDFDGDGRIDLAATTQTGKLSLLRGNGTGEFAEEILYDDPANSFTDLFATEPDEQGLREVVAVGTETVIFQNGPDGFEPTSSLSSIPFPLDAADLDGDDRLDFVTAGSTGFSVLFSDAREAFSISRIRSDPAQSLHLADVDRDGAPRSNRDVHQGRRCVSQSRRKLFRAAHVACARKRGPLFDLRGR